MQITSTYLLQWYGPFKAKDLAYNWCDEHKKYDCKLYLLKGLKQNAKYNSSYYCGISKRRDAITRMSDKGHKINQFREIDEIWVGLICNMKPKNQDIEDAETILTAYLTDEVGKKYMLNERKLYFPQKQICIINRWYHPKTLLPRERLASGSLAQIIPDILLHEYDEYGHYIYGSQKMKQLKCR